MKNSKAVTKGHSTITRLGILSTVTWMVVSFSAGAAMAADTDFKLWELKGENLGEIVKPIESAQTRDRGAELLAKKEFGTVIREFSRPTEFVEVVREAIVDLKGDKKKVEAFKKDITKFVKELPLSSMTSEARDGLAKLVGELFEIDAKELESMKAEDLIKKLFSDETPEFLKALALTNKKSDDKVVDDKTKVDPNEVAPVVGEKNPYTDADYAAAEASATQVCELNKPSDEFEQLKELFRDLKAKDAAQSNFPQVALDERNKDNGLIAQALAQLQKEDEQAQVVPPTTLPQQQAPLAQNEESEQPSALDQQIPQAPQQQQQMPFTAPVAQSDFRMPNLPLDQPLSVSKERKQARDASAAVDEALALKTPPQMNPWTGQAKNPIQYAGELGLVKGVVDGALAEAKVAAQAAKYKLDKETEKLEGKTPSDLLDGRLAETRTQMEAKLKKAESTAQQQTQALQAQLATTQDPFAQQMISSQMGQLQAQVTAAKSELEQFDTQYATQVNQAKKVLDAAKKNLDALSEEHNQLAGKVKKLEARSNEVEQQMLANSQMAQQQNQLVGGGQSPNINRIQQGAGGAAGRVVPRGIGAATARGKI